MNIRLRTVLVLALALLAVRAQADIIVLLDGTTIEGEIVEEDDDKVKIKGRFGTTEIKRREIREITKETSKRAAFLEKYDGLDKGASADDPESWMTLGYWAKREGLREEANKAFARVLQINPNHEQAHQNLGHVRYLGKWITAEEHRQLTSGGGHDAAPPAGGGNNVPRAADNTPARNTDVQALTGTTEKGTGSSKRVKCPDCNGDGITGWFTCKQCKRSPQPGYVYYGERMEKCPTCQGAAKLPGVPCRRCNRSGIVDPEKPVTPFGKFIPPGLELCSDCGGEGYKTWNECNQCKRSEHPGYLDMNGVIQMCNRCHGLGKMPGVRCDKCGTSGMTRKK